MTAVRSAILGTSNEVTEPSLQKFLVEAGLYKYTGLNLDDLKHRPHNEAADYLKIVSLFTQDEINRAKQQKVNTQKGSR